MARPFNALPTASFQELRGGGNPRPASAPAEPPPAAPEVNLPLTQSLNELGLIVVEGANDVIRLDTLLHAAAGCRFNSAGRVLTLREPNAPALGLS